MKLLKKLSLLVLSLTLCVAALAFVSSAEAEPAAVHVATVDELKAVPAGSVAVLDADLTLERELFLRGAIDIDLAGHTLTAGTGSLPAVSVRCSDGTVKVYSSVPGGKLLAADGMSAPFFEVYIGSLEVGEGGNLSALLPSFIEMYGTTDVRVKGGAYAFNGEGAVFTVKGAGAALSVGSSSVEEGAETAARTDIVSAGSLVDFAGARATAVTVVNTLIYSDPAADAVMVGDPGTACSGCTLELTDVRVLGMTTGAAVRGATVYVKNGCELAAVGTGADLGTLLIGSAAPKEYTVNSAISDLLGTEALKGNVTKYVLAREKVAKVVFDGRTDPAYTLYFAEGTEIEWGDFSVFNHVADSTSYVATGAFVLKDKNGATVSSMTVTAEMLGEDFAAEIAYDVISYSYIKTVGTVETPVVGADDADAGNKLLADIKAAVAGTKFFLCRDITLPGNAAITIQSPTSIEFDLNGHTLTTASKFTIKGNTFVYSTAPGGVWKYTGTDFTFVTDNWGTILVLGSATENVSDYSLGANLTVDGARFNLWGKGAKINGGTYILRQSGSYVIGHNGGGGSCPAKYATFILPVKGAAIHLEGIAAETYTGCTFIGLHPDAAAAESAAAGKKATFKDCSFANIPMQSSFSGGKGTATFNGNTRFNTEIDDATAAAIFGAGAKIVDSSAPATVTYNVPGMDALVVSFGKTAMNTDGTYAVTWKLGGQTVAVCYYAPNSFPTYYEEIGGGFCVRGKGTDRLSDNCELDLTLDFLEGTKLVSAELEQGVTLKVWFAKSGAVDSVKVNGAAQALTDVRTLDGKEYYVFTLNELCFEDALFTYDVDVALSLSFRGISVSDTASFKVSLPAYVEALLASDTVAKAERSVAYALLALVKESAVYYYGTAVDVTACDRVLSDFADTYTGLPAFDKTAAPALGAHDAITAGTIVLDRAASVRLKVKADLSETVTVNGTAYTESDYADGYITVALESLSDLGTALHVSATGTDFDYSLATYMGAMDEGADEAALLGALYTYVELAAVVLG